MAEPQTRRIQWLGGGWARSGKGSLVEGEVEVALHFGCGHVQKLRGIGSSARFLLAGMATYTLV